MVILKRIGGMFLRISISLVLLIFLFTQMKPGALLEIVKHADKALLVLAFLITFFSYLFCYLRWKIFLESAGIHLPSKRLVSAFSGGIFFNMFLPSTVGVILSAARISAITVRKPAPWSPRYYWTV
jgi:uncharacterized protein (TIRG00374 family)